MLTNENDDEMKPDRDINLSEEDVAFYLEVGKSLSQWAHVENHLRKTAGLCVSRVDALTIQAGFLSIENFRSKLQFVDALVKRKTKDAALLDRWAALEKRCRSSSQLRNRIAHSKPVLFPEGEPTRRLALVDWEREKRPKGEKTAPPGALCLSNVIQARDEFLALTTALANFREALDGKPEPFAKALERSTDPPTIRDTRNHVRGALGVPRLPSVKKPES